MFDYCIVTDSNSNLSREYALAHELEVMPMSFFVDDAEYKGFDKEKDIDFSIFYKLLREKKNITTSQINLEYASEYFESVLKANKGLLYVGFSSGLSGNFQAVVLVLNELKEKYPDKKICYVDSIAAALGEGLMVHYALKNREDGMDIFENLKWIEENRLNICHWFTVEDLFFLKRGGRVSAATAVVGTALSIKPVMHVDDAGKLIPVENVRGRRRSIDALLKHMEETVKVPENQDIFISHGDCLKDAEYLADKIREKFSVKSIMINVLDPVIGCHSGPGTVALFFVGEKR